MSNITIDDSLEINKITASYVLSDGTNSVSITSPTISSNSNFILPTTAGNTDDVLQWTASGTLKWDIIGGNRQFWSICDVKSSGTNGGIFAKNDWRTRDLNTLNKPSGVGTEVQLAVSPAGLNQLLIQPGTYRFFGQTPARAIDRHKSRLQNISDGVTELLGTSERNVSASNNSYISGFFIVSGSQKIFEIQHYCNGNSDDTGFGIAVSITGINEVYTCCFIEKID